MMSSLIDARRGFADELSSARLFPAPQPAIGKQEVRQRERGEDRGGSKGAAEPILSDDPSHSRGSRADPGVEARENRAEGRAAALGADVPHDVAGKHRVRRAETDAED